MSMSKIQGISFIAPFRYLSTAYQYSDFSMVLTHLVMENSKYRDFYAKTDKPILLDNSFFELGRCLSREDVLEAAQSVGATCVVLTDGKLDDMDFFKSKGYEVMFVPLTWDDLVYSVSPKCKVDKVGISCISSQKLIAKEPFEPCRSELLLKLQETIQKPINCHKVHFLGATNAQLQDLKKAVDNKLVGSIDTSLPIWAGLNKYTLSASSPRYPTHCDFYSNLDWSVEANRNILSFKQCFYYGQLQLDFSAWR